MFLQHDSDRDVKLAVQVGRSRTSCRRARLTSVDAQIVEHEQTTGSGPSLRAVSLCATSADRSRARRRSSRYPGSKHDVDVAASLRRRSPRCRCETGSTRRRGHARRRSGSRRHQHWSTRRSSSSDPELAAPARKLWPALRRTPATLAAMAARSNAFCPQQHRSLLCGDCLADPATTSPAPDKPDDLWPVANHILPCDEM